MKKIKSSYIRVMLPVLLSVIFVQVRNDVSTSGLPKNFSELLTRSHMTYTRPDGFEEVPVIQNRQMNYEYALKVTGQNFEVRYAIRPLDALLKQYADVQKTGNGVSISPNKLYPVTLQAILMNISGGLVGNISSFPKDAVKNDFNADWGATSIVQLGKEFGQDYKFCMVVAIHKDDIGDAYCFYLFNEQNDAKMITSTIFHALKFN